MCHVPGRWGTIERGPDGSRTRVFGCRRPTRTVGLPRRRRTLGAPSATHAPGRPSVRNVPGRRVRQRLPHGELGAVERAVRRPARPVRRGRFCRSGRPCTRPAPAVARPLLGRGRRLLAAPAKVRLRTDGTGVCASRRPIGIRQPSTRSLRRRRRPTRCLRVRQPKPRGGARSRGTAPRPLGVLAGRHCHRYGC
jgi:hypothetical protein